MENFIPIRIATLRFDKPVNFDIFVPIGERFVHYIKKNDPAEADRMQRLLGKGIKKLFIPLDQESLYLAYLDAGLDFLANKSAKIEEKGSMANDTMVTLSENAERNLETEQGYKATQVQIKKVLDFLTSEKGALRSILQASGGTIDNFQHAATVANLSLAIAARCGLTKEIELFELGLAALLHDIGHKGLGYDPMASPTTYNPEQLTAYHSHPVKGAQSLAGKKFVTAGIMSLIANHEEIGTGGGFPEKKNLKTLPLGTQILNLCNDYDRYCRNKGVALHDGMKTFFTDRLGLFELEHMKILKEVLKD